MRLNSSNRSSISGIEQLLQPLAAELLDRERRQHRAVDGGAPEHIVVDDRDVGMAVEVAEESARERVSGARGIDHRLERISGTKKNPSLAEHAGSVAALLDDDDARAELLQLRTAAGRGSARR